MKPVNNCKLQTRKQIVLHQKNDGEIQDAYTIITKEPIRSLRLSSEHKECNFRFHKEMPYMTLRTPLLVSQRNHKSHIFMFWAQSEPSRDRGRMSSAFAEFRSTSEARGAAPKPQGLGILPIVTVLAIRGFQKGTPKNKGSRGRSRGTPKILKTESS